MRKLLVVLVASSVAAVASACSSAPAESTSSHAAPAGSLAVASNTTTSFDATYTLGSAWARARVAYTPSTTLFEITTSHGTVVVRTGTALTVADAAVPNDPRRADEVVRIANGDPEHAVVSGLLDSLLASGASATPNTREAGSTLYAAAFFAAKSLGEVATRTPDQGVSRIETWPHPGYVNKEEIPTELLVPAAGLQNGSGGTTCCGPYECYHAEWNPSLGCDDWCAAGDFCNHWGWGNCGTAMFWPSGGCNSCPHSNSPTIKSSDVQGMNNGTCSISGHDTYSAWDDTFNGPASNFDNYGSYYFGYQCGGEYGNYYGNCGY